MAAGQPRRLRQWAKAHNSLLIVTWDENDGSSSTNKIATFAVVAT